MDAERDLVPEGEPRGLRALRPSDRASATGAPTSTATPLKFCSPEHEQLYHDYWLPRYGAKEVSPDATRTRSLAGRAAALGRLLAGHRRRRLPLPLRPGPLRRRRRAASATTIAEQVRQVLENLDAVARAAGGSLQNAVRVGMYISDMAHFDEMDARVPALLLRPAAGADDDPVRPRRLRRRGRRGRLARRLSVDVASLDTPVATVDLDAVERNIARMQGYCDEHGLAFRPHIKTHKLPAIAHMQLGAGAVGITCQKLGEAEVMERPGIRDILLTFPLVGAAKAERLAALAGEAAVSVVGDSDRGRARALAGARGAPAPRSASSSSATPASTGPACRRRRPRPSSRELVDSLPGLRFDGLMTYPTLPGDRAEAARRRSTRSASRGLEVRVGQRRRARRRSSRTTRCRRSPRCAPGRTSTATARASRTARCRSRTARCGSAPPSSAGRRPSAAILDAGSKTLTNDPAEEAAGGGNGPDRRVPGGARSTRSPRSTATSTSAACDRRPGGGRGRRRSSPTTRAAARTCTTRSSCTGAAGSSAPGPSPPAASFADPDDEGVP